LYMYICMFTMLSVYLVTNMKCFFR
jgi:hypothetical protein